MAKTYVKIVGGIPTGETSLDKLGDDWLEFDPVVEDPHALRVEAGRIMRDNTKHTTRMAEIAKGTTRENALAAAKLTALARFNWSEMTVAEKKIILRLPPTDAELGI